MLMWMAEIGFDLAQGSHQVILEMNTHDRAVGHPLVELSNKNVSP